MEQSRSPVKTINAMKARQNFGQMLEEVYYKGEQFVIERAGKPMAAIVPIAQLKELQKLHGRPRTNAETIKERKRQSHQRKS